MSNDSNCVTERCDDAVQLVGSDEASIPDYAVSKLRVPDGFNGARSRHHQYNLLWHEEDDNNWRSGEQTYYSAARTDTER